MQHAESCQEEADKTAFDYIKLVDEISVLASVQSICDFNIFWLATISPIIIEPRTLKFLADHKNVFKRKITIGEMIEFDWLIKHNQFCDFAEFAQHLKRSRVPQPQEKKQHDTPHPIKQQTKKKLKYV